MTIFQAVFLGVLQGVSELFPVSSLGQTILVPPLLGWQALSQQFAFLVLLHLATAIALLIYFWNDWKVVFIAFVKGFTGGKLIHDRASKFAWLLIVGTPVVGLFGLLFEKRLKSLFDDPKRAWIVALILIVNGVFMLVADYVKRRLSGKPALEPIASANPDAPATDDPATDAPSQRRQAEDLTLIEGAAIGATQTFALLPGISRSGVSIVAGLMAGLSYEEASRFSFMLATPIIGLAALKKCPELFKPAAHGILPIAILAAVVAGVTAYLSTRFLMRYFQHNRLSPFGWYCIVFGLFSFYMLHSGVHHPAP